MSARQIRVLALSAQMREHGTELAEVQVGVDVDDHRVVMILDPDRAQFLAHVLALADAHADAHGMTSEDRDFWIHTLVDLLASAAVAQSTPITMALAELVELRQSEPKLRRVYECPAPECTFRVVERVGDDPVVFNIRVGDHPTSCVGDWTGIFEAARG